MEWIIVTVFLIILVLIIVRQNYITKYMKENFKEYHINDHLDNIYTNSIIVLDTNSILNLYRYSESNRNKYFEILKKVDSRLYLTHQICKEFYKNRLIIIENRSTFKETINELIEESFSKLINLIKNSSGAEKFNSALSILKHEPTLKNLILKDLEKAYKNISSSISDFKQNFDINYIQTTDPILEEFVEIIKDKVSKEFTEEEKCKIYEEGEIRYENEVPPGYKDNEKGSPEKFGDLIIWNELQELSKSTKRPLLFISDDRKEDWAIKFKGYDLGPRKELIKEFNKNTSNLFYSITTTKFIQIISDSYKITDTKKLQEETESIQKNIQQKENELRKNKKERFEYLNILEKARELNEIQDYNKKRELFESFRNPLEEFKNNREILERSKNPLEECN